MVVRAPQVELVIVAGRQGELASGIGGLSREPAAAMALGAMAAGLGGLGVASLSEPASGGPAAA